MPSESINALAGVHNLIPLDSRQSDAPTRRTFRFTAAAAPRPPPATHQANQISQATPGVIEDVIMTQMAHPPFDTFDPATILPRLFPPPANRSAEPPQDFNAQKKSCSFLANSVPPPNPAPEVKGRRRMFGNPDAIHGTTDLTSNHTMTPNTPAFLAPPEPDFASVSTPVAKFRPGLAGLGIVNEGNHDHSSRTALANKSHTFRHSLAPAYTPGRGLSCERYSTPSVYSQGLGTDPDGGDGVDEDGTISVKVFSAMLATNKEKDRRLRIKDEEVRELRQNVEALEGKNAALHHDLKKARDAVKSHQDACNKLLRSAEAQSKELKESFKRSYDERINELRSAQEEFATFKADLGQRVETVQAQLEKEKSFRAEVGQESIRALEDTKHTSDILRDKLIAVTSDLAEAKEVIRNLTRKHENQEARSREYEKECQEKNQELKDLRVIFEKTRNENFQLLVSSAQLEERMKKSQENNQDLLLVQNGLKDQLAASLRQFEVMQTGLNEKSIQLSELLPLRDEHSQLKALLDSALAERHKFSGESNELRRRCIELEARLKEAESRLTEQDDREEREKPLLNQLEDAKGVLSIQGRKLEDSDAEKCRLRDLVEHANLNVQGLTRDLQGAEERFDYQAITLRATKENILELQAQLSRANETYQKTLDHERARVKDLEDNYAKYLLSTQDEKRIWGEDKVTLLQAQAKAEAAESSIRREYNELRSERMRFEEDRVHLLERVSSLQAAQSEHEKTVRKIGRDQEEQKTIIKELESEKSNLSLRLATTERDKDNLAETLARNEKQRYEAIEALKTDANRFLQSSQEESANLLTRIEQLQTERAEQGAQLTVATQRLADAQAALAEQIAQRASLDNHISLVTGNLERAKAELHDALGAAESLATNPERIEELERTIKEMESKASSLLERYKSGSLDTVETTLVKQVMQSALEVNQHQLVQKSNDLKRRETETQELRERVKDLEKQLVQQFKQKESGAHPQVNSAQAPLIRAQDVANTSPLVEEQPFLMKAAPEHDPTTESTAPISPLTCVQPSQESPLARKPSNTEPKKFSAMNESGSSDYHTDWSELPQALPITRLGKRLREEGTVLGMTRSSRRRKITDGDVVSGATASRVRATVETVSKQKKRR